MPVAQDERIYVVIHQKPNKVWVCLRDQWHTANWRTTDNGDSLRNIVGNAGLLSAALLAWGKFDHPVQNQYVTTARELEERSDGYGIGYQVYPPV